jgi:hypothetical protein
MRVGILKRPDGGISIVNPAPHLRIEDVIDKANPEGLPVVFMDTSELPPDRVFRNAWKHLHDKIDIDKKEAEKLHMDRLRMLRKKQLEKLDIEFTKALGRKDENLATLIEEQRQELRDMPDNFDLSAIPLKSLPEAQPPYLDGDVRELKKQVPK